nr:GNAT family N-acetyltransferase [Bacilli bacterium]
MKNINEIWLKDKLKNKCNIESLKNIKEELLKISETYRDVFNGTPFYESWDIESARSVIDDYKKQNATILVSNYLDSLIGFLVAIDFVPDNQRDYVQYLNNIKYIEEIGVLSNFRNQKVASEMIRVLLLNYLSNNTQYLGYRTNAMRYFEYDDKESFESAVMRVQNEDKIKRMNNEKIIVPTLTDSEKQDFINKYIELIKYRPDLDVSNSSAMFRDIFGDIDYNKINNNYSFQKDPTGDYNDRIFPFINLSKNL